MEIPSVDCEIVHIAAAEVRLKRRIDICYGKSQLLAFFSIDIHLVSRRVRTEEGKNAAEFGAFVRRRHKCLHGFFKLLDVVGAFVLLEFECKAARLSEAGDCRRRNDYDIRAFNRREFLLQCCDERVQLQ